MASSFLASQSLTLTLKPYLFSPPKPNFPLKKRSISSSSSSTQTVGPIQLNPPRVYLTGSTRTLTTLAGVTLTATKMLTTLGFQWSGSFGLQQVLVNSAGPAFFAAVRNQTVGPLNTPLTLVAAGLAKWLDIYSGVLMVRVLLSWFPNIPWEKQPLSAIRDLCDPYLNLFRNIIPPIFDTLDVSPLLAFAVLGTLGSILNSTRGSY